MLCFGPEAKLFKIMKRMRVWIFAIKKKCTHTAKHTCLPQFATSPSEKRKKERKRKKRKTALNSILSQPKSEAIRTTGKFSASLVAQTDSGRRQNAINDCGKIAVVKVIVNTLICSCVCYLQTNARLFSFYRTKCSTGREGERDYVIDL